MKNYGKQKRVLWKLKNKKESTEKFVTENFREKKKKRKKSVKEIVTEIFIMGKNQKLKGYAENYRKKFITKWILIDIKDQKTSYKEALKFRDILTEKEPIETNNINIENTLASNKYYIKKKHFRYSIGC